MAEVKILFLISLLILIAGCKETNYVSINNNVFEIELAETPEEKATGLMYREELEENKGMLFVYDNEAIRSFWMKNTLIPLDMIFIDSNNTIIDVTTMQPCKQDPCGSYTSKEEAMYVLEINAGLSEKLNIEPGDKIEIR